MGIVKANRGSITEGNWFRKKKKKILSISYVVSTNDKIDTSLFLIVFILYNYARRFVLRQTFHAHPFPFPSKSATFDSSHFLLTANNCRSVRRRDFFFFNQSLRLNVEVNVKIDFKRLNTPMSLHSQVSFYIQCSSYVYTHIYVYTYVCCFLAFYSARTACKTT